jgi:hypothetical protein
MKRRWSIILPLCGLLLFGTITFASHLRHQTKYQGRIYYWAGYPLDPDPLHIDPPKAPVPCPQGQECVAWDPISIWSTPGPLMNLLIFTGLPGLLVGALIVSLLSRMGVNEIWSFFVCMPVTLSAWYYLIGWLLDRRRWQKQLKKQRP